MIEDSGKRYENELGGVRDTDEGKTNYRLIPVESLKRVADHYTAGMIKYKRGNWELLSTDEDIERFKDSAYRHLMDYFEGKTNEDHLAACVFNIFSIMYFEEQTPKIDKEGLFDAIGTITSGYLDTTELQSSVPGLNVNYVVTKKTQFEKEIEGE